MKTVFTICVIIMLCVYIAVDEREIKVTKEEAYWDGFRKGLKECPDYVKENEDE